VIADEAVVYEVAAAKNEEGCYEAGVIVPTEEG